MNSDQSIKRIKGPNRPIIRQYERVLMISAFRLVDYVFIYDDVVADDFIISLKPNVFAIGEESFKIYPNEPATAMQVGALLQIVTRIISPSTTSILMDVKEKNKKINS